MSWSGYELSGNSIPNQLPVELYDQYNIAAQSVCVDDSGGALVGYCSSTGTSCDSDDDCEEAESCIDFAEEGDPGLPLACGTYEDCPDDTGNACSTDSDCIGDNMSGVCNTATNDCYFACANASSTDYRLVYNAGPCDSTESGDGNGGSCTVGTCEDSGAACASIDDCADDEACVVGYCQATGDTNCVNDDCSCNPDDITEAGVYTDCVGVTAGGSVPTNVCDPAQFVCVDELTSDVAERNACVTSSACGSQRDCVPASTSTVGSCFNDRCLADITDGNGDGYADRLEADDAREQACRAYPEIDSPFPEDVVTEWRQYSDAGVDTDSAGTTTDEMDADGYSAGQVSTDLTSSPVNQAAIPYTFVNGFQDSTVCALDENGDVVDCSCSYDKAEYGDGTGYRYFGLGTGVDGVPQGICSGGPVAGIPCINDDDCSISTDSDEDFEQAGICSLVSRVDSVYGWSGYCIEKDSSIQTLGSSQPEDQACLTWLPVDQLTGATDLYAKYTSAGFAPQDTYYCAEVGTAYNVWTSSIACAEVQDNLCNDGSWPAFRDESDSIGNDGSDSATDSASGEDDCIAAVFCPEGYFAVMTGCGNQSVTSSGDRQCEDNGLNDMDCPYFCVPKRSYKIATEETQPAGTPCEIPTERWGGAFGTGEGYIVTPSSIEDYYAPNPYTPDMNIYVMMPSDFATAHDFYDDCAVQGVTDSIDEYYQYANEDYEEVVTGIDGIFASDGTRTKGYRNLFMGYESYPACLTTVKVSNKTPEEDGEFESYNAAWTDRLFVEQTAFPALEGTDLEHLGYSYSTALIPYGRAIDWLNMEAVADPSPHRILMCKDENNPAILRLPLVDGSCEIDDFPTGTEAVANASDFQDARAFVNISQSTDIPLVNQDWCQDPSTCLCGTSSGTPSEAMCNWDGGSAIECGNPQCVGGDFAGNACVIPTDEAPADSCAPGGGYCAGSCQGGPNNGEQCGTDDPDDVTCEVNFCTNVRSCLNESGSSLADCLDQGPLYACRVIEPEFTSGTVLSSGTPTTALARLSQLFNKMYGIVEFEDGYDNIREIDPSEAFEGDEIAGEFTYYTEENYDDFSDEYGEWDWDTRGVREDAQEFVPQVWSIGDCDGTQCYEGVKDKFSVNETDSEDIEGEGSKRVTVSFYAFADSDQMPIRRVIVDWGDNVAGIGGEDSNPWPFGSYSGSITGDNFYRNHRGLSSISNAEQCSELSNTFGELPNACTSSYIAFTHDYTCTTGRLSALSDRACEFDEDGRLLNSPCIEGSYCVYQPRVHVMDNWGGAGRVQLGQMIRRGVIRGD